MKFNPLDILLPRETKFYGYMREQADVFVAGCHTFKSLVANIENMSEEEIRKKLAEIKECEFRGDEVEHRIIDELHKTFITPIDREDIHSITINLDKALDILNSISQKIEIYGIRKVPSNVVKFADVINEIAAELRNLINSLEEKSQINRIIERMHSLENKGDYLFHLSMADLFHGDQNPIDVIKFKEVYEHLENIVDAVDYIGKLVRGVMVKLG